MLAFSRFIRDHRIIVETLLGQLSLFQLNSQENHILMSLSPGSTQDTSVIPQRQMIVTWFRKTWMYSFIGEKKWQSWNAQLLFSTHDHTSNCFYHETKCICACAGCVFGQGWESSWRETKKLSLVKISSYIFKVKKWWSSLFLTM